MTAFTTGLWLPTYRPGRAGAWELSVQLLAGARGYWGDLYPLFETAILKREADGDHVTWMSIVPMEIESQEIGIRAARGHTVVLGLGMGWAAANIALNPAATRVTVVEPQKWDDVRRLQASIGAASLYFWGQEMELWRLACRRAGRVPDRLSRTDLDALVSQTGLPLIVSPAPDHGDRIAAGAPWWTPAMPGWWRPDAPTA